MRSFRRSGFLSVGVLLAGCVVGDLNAPNPTPDDDKDNIVDDKTDDNDDPIIGDDGVVQDYSVTLGQTPSTLTLGTELQMQITVSSTNYAGTVELAPQGVPESWNVRLEPSATVTLEQNGTAEATMVIEIPTTASAETATVSVQSSSELGQRTASTELTVENTLVIPIDQGTNDGAHKFTEVALRVGTQVTFVNYDGIPHRIHAGAERAGFPHQSGMMLPAEQPGSEGGSYSVTITEAGNFGFYCHFHGRGSDQGRLSVSAD